MKTMKAKVIKCTFFFFFRFGLHSDVFKHFEQQKNQQYSVNVGHGDVSQPNVKEIQWKFTLMFSNSKNT